VKTYCGPAKENISPLDFSSVDDQITELTFYGDSTPQSPPPYNVLSRDPFMMPNTACLDRRGPAAQIIEFSAPLKNISCLSGPIGDGSSTLGQAAVC